MNLIFNEQGLIPSIAQQHDTGQVLMLAWMNQQAVDKTLETGEVHYYSRSRQELWHKGATSGHIQTLIEMRFDCDRDALLLQVNQAGVACHTNRASCFYHAVTAQGVKEILHPVKS